MNFRMYTTIAYSSMAVFFSCRDRQPPPGDLPQTIASIAREPLLDATAYVADANTEIKDVANVHDSNEPSLYEPDGRTLPQTNERPSIRSSSFNHRIELLWQAIVKNDPELAIPAFFPLEAYQQVKAIAHPQLDWQQRLIAAYRRDIRNYHRRLGASPEAAQFLRIDVPEGQAQWMLPGREGNKVGYFRVLRSTIHFRRADGLERALEITSMISWRGEWYIVHLSGFK